MPKAPKKRGIGAQPDVVAKMAQLRLIPRHELVRFRVELEA
jgi:hypothetical protein